MCFSSGLKDNIFFRSPLQLAVKKGLSHDDALAALTITPASLIGIENKTAILEKGMLANFIITSGNIFNDGFIYENWTLGEQNIIKEKQSIDFRGYYTFKSKEFESETIIIEGSLSEPKTKFPALDSNSVITNINENIINIFNADGSFRSIGKLINNNISGRYQNKDGEYFNFSMKRDSLFKDIKKNLPLLNLLFQMLLFQMLDLELAQLQKVNLFILRMLRFGQMKMKEF